MATKKTPRDKAILAALKRGETLKSVGQRFRISPQRVHQISQSGGIVAYRKRRRAIVHPLPRALPRDASEATGEWLKVQAKPGQRSRRGRVVAILVPHPWS